MPKAPAKARKTQTAKGKIARQKLTFTCACTGGCNGRTREISEALFKRHATFRELDEAIEERDVDGLALPPEQQASSIIQGRNYDEPKSVSLRKYKSVIRVPADELQFEYPF